MCHTTEYEKFRARVIYQRSKIITRTIRKSQAVKYKKVAILNSYNFFERFFIVMRRSYMSKIFFTMSNYVYFVLLTYLMWNCEGHRVKILNLEKNNEFKQSNYRSNSQDY
jgi:hypothetical protein